MKMTKLRNPRVVKIFFSSPFGGMEEEREELTKRYFPSVRHLCNSYGLQFAAVDMRWGITAESSDKAQVISICLREIDRSDMFIGFFGQRYGWHGADDEGLQKNFENALPQYPWLDQFRDKSVTELEFLHGFLNNPGQLSAAIFFRDKQYDDLMREDGLQKGDKKQIFKYSAESELSTQLMADLKHRVLQHKEKSLGVYMDYKTPAEAAKIMYDTIMAYLKDTLLVEYAEQKKHIREDLLSQHDAFLASRCNVFVHGETYMQQLNKQLLSENGQNVFVTGAAGMGKSALLCNWISSLKQDSSRHAIVYHFIGFADGSTDVNSILSRLSIEFEYILSKMTDGTSQLEDTSGDLADHGMKEDRSGERTIQLCQRLLTAIDKLISLGKTPILVLDGLDKVIITSKIKKALFWLPSHFPASAMVVVSTLESDTQNIEELTNRNYLRIHIDPLPNEFKHEMSVKTLQESGKELSPPQLERIVAADMTKNPLFLKLTLSELLAFGYFRLLDKKIDSLITSASTEALLQQILIRLEEDYNVSDYNGNLVESVMSGIQLSSQGLSEMEVKEIFSIPDHIWSPLYFAIENLTINQSGRIQFGYKELGDAVSARYLQDGDKKQVFMKKLVEYFTHELEQLNESDYLTGEELTICRPAYELPPLFLKLHDTTKLAECLSNYFVFLHLGTNSPYLLVELWHHTDLLEEDIVDRLLATFDKHIAEIYLFMEEQCVLEEHKPPGLMAIRFLTLLEHVMSIAGYAEARKKVIERAIHIMEDGVQNGKVKDLKDKEFLINLKYRLACIYCDSRQTAEEGIRLHKEILKQFESQVESTGPTSALLVQLGHSSHGIGVGYAALDNYSEVEHYVMQSIKYHEESGIGLLSDLGASWSVLALCYLKQENYEKALQYTDKAIEAYETHHFGETPPIIGEMLTNKALCLKRLGRMEEAEAVYQKSLAVKINAVGRKNEIVAMAYINLCALEGQRGNYDKGKQYAQQAMQIFESLGHARHNPKYLGAWENLLLCLVMKESFAEADEDFMTVLKWRIEDGSMDEGLGSVYRDMARYYLREQMYEKAYLASHTLIGSRFREEMNGVTYILLDFACDKLPASYREQLTEEYTLAYAVERHPENVSLVKVLVENHLVPRNDTEEIARLINRLHSHSDMEDQVYVLSSDWCVNSEGQVNEECQQAILEQGLLKYPDNLDLHINMAKSYRRMDQPELALPHALKVVEEQKDNPPLVLFTAHTAVLAQECDICEKWCSYLLENFKDESVTTPANNILKANEEVREHLKQQQQQEAAE